MDYPGERAMNAAIDSGRNHRGTGWAAVIVAAALASCAEPETEKLPQVSTTGPHAVEVGAAVQIVPTTINGKDKGYSFVSAAAAIATVDEMGRVTGVAAGETAVTVTGTDTKATVQHAVVVVPVGALPDGGAPPDAASDGAVPATVPAAEVPFYAAWLNSAHADRTAPAFTNWNKDGMVPTTCARCHSSEGFVDYLGGDNTVPGKVDNPAPIE
jgi:hypothetical protein